MTPVDVGVGVARPVGAARTVTGRRYRLAGETVTVLTAWGPGGGPRNVRIQWPDGSTTVRPFRGLRRLTGGEA